jgi:hypothetical protein
MDDGSRVLERHGELPSGRAPLVKEGEGLLWASRPDPGSDPPTVTLQNARWTLAATLAALVPRDWLLDHTSVGVGSPVVAELVKKAGERHASSSPSEALLSQRYTEVA